MRKKKMGRRRMRSRWFALALCFSMLFSGVGMSFATDLDLEIPAESGTQEEESGTEELQDGLCIHHPVHTQACGYVEEKSPCTHKHTDDCYEQIVDCVLEREESQEPVSENPSEEELPEETVTETESETETELPSSEPAETELPSSEFTETEGTSSAQETGSEEASLPTESSVEGTSDSGESTVEEPTEAEQSLPSENPPAEESDSPDEAGGEADGAEEPPKPQDEPAPEVQENGEGGEDLAWNISVTIFSLPVFLSDVILPADTLSEGQPSEGQPSEGQPSEGQDDVTGGLPEEGLSEEETDLTEQEHVCSVESGCIIVTDKLICSHREEGMHDAECGYAPTVVLNPCTFDCPVCDHEYDGSVTITFPEEIDQGTLEKEEIKALSEFVYEGSPVINEGNYIDLLGGVTAEDEEGGQYEVQVYSVLDVEAEEPVELEDGHWMAAEENREYLAVYVALDENGEYVAARDRDFEGVQPYGIMLLKLEDPAARIGGTEYETLQGALDAAEDNETVTLLRDVEESVTINREKNLTLDLGSYTITAAEAKPVVTVTNGKVTIQDGTITGGDGDGAGIYSEAELTVKQLTVTGNGGDGTDNGGGICQIGGSLTIQDSTICENSAGKFGGGIYAEGAAVTLETVTVSQNTASPDASSSKGGGIYLDGVSGIIQGCVLTENIATNAGALMLTGTDGLTIENTEIKDNTSAVALGGGSSPSGVVMLDSCSSISMAGCTVEGNTGGGNSTILLSGTELSFTNGKVTGNTAGRAGAFDLRKSAKLTVSGTLITGNEGREVGNYTAGGVSVYGGTFTMLSGALYQNATAQGGYDLYTNATSASVDIIPAAEMQADGQDFTGYIWYDPTTETRENGALSYDNKKHYYFAVSSAELDAGEAVVVHEGTESAPMSFSEALDEAVSGDTIRLIAGTDENPSAVRLVQTKTLYEQIQLDLNGRTLCVLNARYLQVNSGAALDITGPGEITGGYNVNVSHNYCVAVQKEGKLTLCGDVKVRAVLSSGNTTICDGAAVEKLSQTGGQMLLDTAVDHKMELLLRGITGTTGSFAPKPGTHEATWLTVGDTFSMGSGGEISVIFLGVTGAKNDLTGSNDNKSFFTSWKKDKPGTLLLEGQNGSIADIVAVASKITVPGSEGIARIFANAADGTITMADINMSNVYISGEGDDANNGYSASSPVKTFAKAQSLLLGVGECKIYVVGAPVSVTGEESWASETGRPITLVRDSADKYTGSLVSVSGSLTLENITLEGDDSGNSPLVQVKDGALTLAEGAVLENNSIFKDINSHGGAIYNDGGTVTISGGTIRDCKAYHGGAIFSRGGSVVMSDGLLENNNAVIDGGAVLLGYGAQMTLSGGTISGNRAEDIRGTNGQMLTKEGLGYGGAIAVGAYALADNDGKALLTMTGGELSGNRAEQAGGGIFIQCDNTAELSGGKILSNTATNGDFAGGGIYVNGGKGSRPNGELTVLHAVINGNRTTSKARYGGGVAGCPTSNVKVYAEDAAIYGNGIGANEGNMISDDVAVYRGIYGTYSGYPDVDLPDYMPGTQPYLWKTPGTGDTLSASELHLSGSAPMGWFRATAAGRPSGFTPSLYIVNNLAGGNGGGIASNGNVTIGRPSSGSTEISVEKKWEGFAEEELPDSVTVWLLRDGVRFAKEYVKKADGWKATFKDLPEGEYTIEEDEESLVGSGSCKVEKSGANSWTITNIANLTVEGVKNWDVPAGLEGKIPASITVVLYQNGEPYGDSKTVSAADGWKYSWTELPKYDATGAEYVYTVKEESVPEGYTGKAGDGYDLVNTLITTTEVEGVKSWDVPAGLEGKIPASITVVLYQNGEPYGESKTVSAADGWKYSWTELPKYDATGAEYVYTVKEESVPEGYTGKAGDGYDLVNTLITTTEVEGVKSWDVPAGLEGKIPASITVVLYQNGEPYGESKTVSAADGWKYRWTELPKYDATGAEYVYTVKEESVPEGYTGKAGDGYDLVNTLITTTEVEGVKSWDVPAGLEGKIPASITVVLYQNGEPYGESKTVSAADGWKYSWTELPKYDASGAEYVYTVQESEVPEGYTVSKGTGYDLVNTLITTTEVEGVKSWDVPAGLEGKIPPSITVVLYQNGAPYGESKTVSAADGWKYSWTELPKYDATGAEYVYTVKEESVPEGYTGKAGEGYDLVNTLITTTEVEGVKSWDVPAGLEGKIPASITVVLYQNGEPYGESKMVSAADGWKYSWTELPKYDATGTEYVYTVKEESVPEGYTGKAGEGYDLVNTLITTTEVEGVKSWDVPAGLEGKIPASITVVLYQNGEPYGESKTVSAADGWKYSWTELPKYDATGAEYVYTVQEPEVPEGYTVSKGTGYDLVNTLITTTEVEGVKNWDVPAGLEGKIPASITVVLYQNGEPYGESKTVSAADGWKYSWTELPKYDASGAEYVYTVQEPEVPEGYTGKAGEGYDLVNTLITTTEVEGVKNWDVPVGLEGKIPASITVVLYQNGEPYGESKTVSAADGWKYSWTELPKYDATGAEYVYTVKEESVPEGYTGKAGDGYDLVNTLITTTEVEGVKSWDVPAGLEGKIPASITVVLYQNGVPYGESKTVSAADGWKYSWTELPKYDATGAAYVYTVKEESVPEGYTGKAGEGYDLVNTLITTTEVEGVKNWDVPAGLESKIPASITVVLYQNREPYGESKTVSAADGWKYSWTELPKYDATGAEYVYTVQESEVPKGYTGKAGDGYDLVNTLITTTEVEGVKSWDVPAGLEGKIPASITVVLYQNGEPYGDSKTVSAADGWKYSWTELPKYDATGAEYVYTVKEESVPEGYTGKAGDGYDLVNTLITTTEVEGVKSWDVPAGLEGKIPASITVVLYQNGVPYGESKTVSAADGWKYSWTELPKFDASGAEYVYTVKEESVPEGYTGKAGEGYDLVNTLITTTEVEGVKSWDVPAGLEGKIPASITVVLYQNGEPYGESKTVSAADGWKYSWTGLPKYDASGAEYVYTVDEVPVRNFGKRIEGYNIINSYKPEETPEETPEESSEPETESTTESTTETETESTEPGTTPVTIPETPPDDTIPSIPEEAVVEALERQPGLENVMGVVREVEGFVLGAMRGVLGVRTGDDSVVFAVVYSILILVSGGVIVGIVVRRRRKENGRK